MRLLLIALLLYVVPAWAQWGGDSRFYRTDPIPREGLIVDLDFSQFSYSGGVYTIRNMANAAAPAYMYGGLDFNSVGSDSSGLSRDIHTGRVVLALDGSAGDSVIVTLPTVIDSTSNYWTCFDFKPKVVNWVIYGHVFFAMRNDTSGTSLNDNSGLYLSQVGDSLHAVFDVPNGSGKTIKRAGVFGLGVTTHIDVVRSGNSRIIYINNDSSMGFSAATNQMRTNKIRFGGTRNSATNKATGAIFNYRLYGRAPTSAERTTLLSNSLRGIHSKKKFSRW